MQIFTNTHQVLLVAGGMDDLVNWGTLSSTEVGLQKITADTFLTQIATYTGGSRLDWVEVESGKLPSPRAGLKAATIGNALYVTGGLDFQSDAAYTVFSSILYWDQVLESWQKAGDLVEPRADHAVVAIPSSIIESECSAMFL